MNIESNIKKYLLIAGGLLLVAVLFFLRPADSGMPGLPEKVDFNFHIRPILSQNCFVCHGPDESTRKAGLRLDKFNHAVATLESGHAAIVPGDADGSILINRVTSPDAEQVMPPPASKKSLTPYEVALLERWIDQGAEWKQHWAFISPKYPELPGQLNNTETFRLIDHFINKEIAARELTTAGPADKSQLIRRVAYLLTGLPPGSEDVERFLADTAANAYDRMIDQYLDSPHFGERWARHWMDLVRYGDTMGHEFDYAINGSNHYRDYLIRAFNDDLPYRQLVMEHLAGDMLPAPRYHTQEGFNESVLGTGYFFLGEGKHSPVSTRQEEADRIDNAIDVTTKTFQAMTVACARCHDHKFDPIPTTDYYAMYGMFETTRIVPHPLHSKQRDAALASEIKSIEAEIRQELAELLPRSGEDASAQAFSIQKVRNNTNPARRTYQLNDTSSYTILGDFRNGSFDGWESEGLAFGEAPLLAKPLLDTETGAFQGLRHSVASSRALAPGITGALRSPNFIIDYDSIRVKASGRNGTIRIVVDNFLVIQDPLYGSLERVVRDSLGKEIFSFDLSLVQGHKAYIEIRSGHFERHIYRLSPEDYVEVDYAIGVKGAAPDTLPVISPSAAIEDPAGVLQRWISGETKPGDGQQLDSLLERLPISTPKSAAFIPLLNRQDSLAAMLRDSTFFWGLREGEAIYSPVFIRGSHSQLAETGVPHGFLSAINSGPEPFPQRGSGRLAWASAVVDPSNPLTSRVIVNRIWHHLFGRGIVETVDNFGLQGKLPSHPELLDVLALRFMEADWSIKQMIRNILLSDAFRRSTNSIAESKTADPENIFLHQFPVRRLEAEAIRDGLLTISGRLDSTIYGESVRIHLTEFMTGRGRPDSSGALDGDGRRSLYLSVRRNFPVPFLQVFDQPMPFSTFGRRNTTNVPAQSLALMNDPFIHQQAAVWAADVLRRLENQSTEERIKDIYLKAFARPATNEEVSNGRHFLEEQINRRQLSPDAAASDVAIWTDYCHTIINLKEFIYLL